MSKVSIETLLGIVVTAGSLLVVISLSLLDALSENNTIIETIYRAFILMTCGFELNVATIAVLLALNRTETWKILLKIMVGSFLLGVISLFVAVCVHETQKGLDGVWIVILVMGIAWIGIVLYYMIDSIRTDRQQEMQTPI